MAVWKPPAITEVQASAEETSKIPVRLRSPAGTITATGALDGAGIGGGGSGGDGTVTISGGNITARGGSSDNPKAICGAGIGGGGGFRQRHGDHHR